MRFLFLTCILLVALSGFGQAKRAQNLIEKKKYEQAYELLETSLKKDSVSAAIPYVLSGLFLLHDWPSNQLDSAYYFSLLSLKKYDVLDEKHLDKHIKDGFGKTKLVFRKVYIDSLAFTRAKTKGTQNDFQQFINSHPSAKELDSAIYYRNSRAFSRAQKIHTLESYRLFLKNYPKAMDWVKANAIYQKMLYTSSTMEGSLQAFKSFIINHPNSPYRNKAINHIFTIEAGVNTPMALVQFIQNYPGTRATTKATGLLYHMHLAHSSAASFTDKYPTVSISDSLTKVIHIQNSAWVPVKNGGFYALVDLTGKVLIDSISELLHYKSGLDFIAAKRKGNYVLTGKNGATFYQSKHFTYLGANKGFIMIKEAGKVKIVHKNGMVIPADEAVALVPPFIANKKGGKWGLKSVTNRSVLSTTYDSIWAENNLLFLKIGPNYTATTAAHLYPALNNQRVQLIPFFDEYEWLSNQLLWVGTKGKEALYSQKLFAEVPVGNHIIELTKTGWSVTTKKAIGVHGFMPGLLSSYNENNDWQVGTIKDSIVVTYHNQKLFIPKRAKLIGTSAIQMQLNDTVYVFLNDSVRFVIPTTTQVIPQYNQSNQVCFYRLVFEANQTNINVLGDTIQLPDYEKITPLSRDFIKWQKNDEVKLYSTNGRLLLEDFEGIALVNDSTLSILNNQKFGLLQPFDSMYIQPFASQKLQNISDSVWVFSLPEGKGLLTSSGHILVAAHYDEIIPWVHTLVFIKKDLTWLLFDLTKAKFVETGIVTYHSITRWGSPKIVYQKGIGMGVFDSNIGVVLPPTFTSVSLEGTEEHPFYRAEKYVEEAGLHIMLFYSLNGKLMFQNILNHKDFNAIYGN